MQQRERLERLEANKATRWRVTEQDWEYYERYERVTEVATRTLRETSTEYAPWTLIAGAEPRFRNLTVGKTVLRALQEPARHERSERPSGVVETPADRRYVLDSLDLTAQVGKQDYRRELERLQGRLNLAVRDESFRDRGLVVVFEGWDAAGKGGAIRRIAGALDARSYRVYPIAAPSDEELARPYLWEDRRYLSGFRWAGRVAVAAAPR